MSSSTDHPLEVILLSLEVGNRHVWIHNNPTSACTTEDKKVLNSFLGRKYDLLSYCGEKGKTVTWIHVLEAPESLRSLKATFDSLPIKIQPLTTLHR